MSDDDVTPRLREAAAWQMCLTEDGGTFNLAHEVEFAQWHADPGNAAAWDRLMMPWALIGEHANDAKMVAYRQAALSDAKTTSASLHRAVGGWSRRQLVAASAAALGVGVGVGGYYWATGPMVYATAFGERRTVRLADGSTISLDSDSEVTVRYTRDARQLHLLKGQARFDVAHDVERPFSVVARAKKVIATGTAFNIDMTEAKLLVTLIEGHVVVVDESVPVGQAVKPLLWPRHRTVDLKAGQQLAALQRKPPQIVIANVRNVTAWTEGQLIFDDQPLSEVVARVGHYAASPILIADKDVGAMRISGSFNTGDVDGFLDIVTKYLPIKEQADAQGNIVLLKK